MVYVHVTLLPALQATGELKTKPTQHSVKELRGIGIQPDVIILRSDHPVSDEIREKIALFTDVAPEAVIPAETADTIYEVPLLFEEAGLGELLVRDLGLADVARRARPRRAGATSSSGSSARSRSWRSPSSASTSSCRTRTSPSPSRSSTPAGPAAWT